MLLVNGFKPVQTNYNNQNSNKANFSRSQFHTKADSVSFTSLASAADKAAAEKMAALTQGIGANYADVLGENFGKIIGNINSFLASHGLSIQHGKTSVVYCTDSTHSIGKGSVTHKVSAVLVDNVTGKPIHSTVVRGANGLTKNEAVVRLYNSVGIKPIFDLPFINFKDRPLYSFTNPLCGVQSPPDLAESTQKVQRALDELRKSWFEIPCDNDDTKVQLLRGAHNILMPEA
jgi:hypothetical protein